jgi:hypothetical protein
MTTRYGVGFHSMLSVPLVEGKPKIIRFDWTLSPGVYSVHSRAWDKNIGLSFSAPLFTIP